MYKILCYRWETHPKRLSSAVYRVTAITRQLFTIYDLIISSSWAAHIIGFTVLRMDGRRRGDGATMKHALRDFRANVDRETRRIKYVYEFVRLFVCTDALTLLSVPLLALPVALRSNRSHICLPTGWPDWPMKTLRRRVDCGAPPKALVNRFAVGALTGSSMSAVSLDRNQSLRGDCKSF